MERVSEPLNQDWQTSMAAAWDGQTAMAYSLPVRGLHESLIPHLLSDKKTLATGASDSLLLAALQNEAVALNEKTGIIKTLHESIFNDQVEVDNKPALLNGRRVGLFLGSVAAVFTGVETDEVLKKTIKESISRKDLMRALEESAQYRWDAKDISGLIDGFSSLQTLEEFFGQKEGEEIRLRVAKKAIAGRELDKTLERAARDVSSEYIIVDESGNEIEANETNRNEAEKKNGKYRKVMRGFSIWLGVRGAEVTEAILQDAYLTVCHEDHTTPHISPYYRNSVLTTDLDFEKPDTDRNLLTPAETIAQQIRVKLDGQIRGPVELPLPAKVNNAGEVSILPAPPQVGDQVAAGVGFAINQAKDAEREGKKITATVMNVMGDGALPMLSRVLQPLGASKAPVVNVVLDNGIAIGVNKKEIYGGKEISKVGEAYGVPGIHVDLTDFDKLYLSTYFASYLASHGGGSTIIDVETIRLAPHSNAHGNSQGAESIVRILENIERMQDDVPYYRNISREAIIQELERIGVKSNLLEVRAALLRLREVLVDEPIGFMIEEVLNAELNRIVDPLEAYNQQLLADGLIEETDVAEMQQTAFEKMNAAYDAVKEEERPSPKDPFNNFNILYPRPAAEFAFEGELKLDGAKAFNTAILRAMLAKPNLFYMGVDVNKGPTFHLEKDGSVTYYVAGGYWNLSKDLARKVGGQVINTMIDELTATQIAMGMTLTSTRPDMLASSPVVIFDGQYKDYGDKNFSAFKDSASRHFTTGGLMTSRVLYLAGAGLASGGGSGHAREDLGLSFMTPYEVPIFYASTPSVAYHLMSHLLSENGVLTPTIMAWDKAMWNVEETFGFDPDLVPGRARVVKEGNGLQVLTFGPSIRKSLDAFNRIGLTDAGLMDLFTIRPLPRDDILDFLRTGSGPISIVQEDPLGQGYGDIMISLLLHDQELRKIAEKRGIHLFASGPVSAPACDGVYQYANSTDLVRGFRELTKSSRT